MARESVRHLGVDSNIHCTKVYPVLGSRKSISDLKSVGIKLTRAQAVHLAQALAAAAREWKDIDITAYRAPNKSDLLHHVTVTGLR